MIDLRPGLLAVTAREVRWIRRDPVARFLLFGVPVIAFVLLGLTFSAAVVRGLDVVVVDMDNSATSRLFVQTVAAAPGITIANARDDLGAAASAIRAGRRHRRDLSAAGVRARMCWPAARRARSPSTTRSIFTPGNNASKSISDAMTALPALRSHPRRQRVARPAEPAPGLVPEEYVLTNPALNYAAVPAARGAADRAARGDRDLGGLRGRLGVPAPQHARLVGHLRAQHRHRAGRQAAAVFRRAACDVRADGRHPRRVARRQLPRQRAC